jgi:hypothetical protein
MLDAWGIGVLSQSLAGISNTRFFFEIETEQKQHRVRCLLGCGDMGACSGRGLGGGMRMRVHVYTPDASCAKRCHPLELRPET